MVCKRKFKARKKSMRQKIWTSMRVLSPKPFTVPGLCRTVEGVTESNVQSYVSRLFKAGYLAKVGLVKRGFCGEYQKYRLVKDTGPVMPVLFLGRFEKKEKEKETEREKERVDTLGKEASDDDRGPHETAA